MKRNFCLLFLALISACATKHQTAYRPVCLDRLEDARQLGDEIFEDGFVNRVNYWVNGDPQIQVGQLGLMWDGFEHSLFCPKGGYPIIIVFDRNDSQFSSEHVLRWSEIVLTNMLRERGIEAHQGA